MTLFIFGGGNTAPKMSFWKKIIYRFCSNNSPVFSWSSFSWPRESLCSRCCLQWWRNWASDLDSLLLFFLGLLLSRSVDIISYFYIIKIWMILVFKHRKLVSFWPYASINMYLGTKKKWISCLSHGSRSLGEVVVKRTKVRISNICVLSCFARELFLCRDSILFLLEWVPYTEDLISFVISLLLIKHTHTRFFFKTMEEHLLFLFDGINLDRKAGWVLPWKRLSDFFFFPSHRGPYVIDFFVQLRSFHVGRVTLT